MAYFPLFIDLKDKKVLVIGGGKVAERKVKVLLQFEPKISVVAKDVKSEEIKKLADSGFIKLYERPFSLADIDFKDLVIVAVDDLNLQKKVYEECVKRRIPVNSVDSVDYCSFIFPSIIKEDEIVIGISTSGKAPALSRRLRKLIKDCLPKDIKSILKEVISLRESLPKGRERQKILVNFLKKRFGDTK